MSENDTNYSPRSTRKFTRAVGAGPIPLPWEPLLRAIARRATARMRRDAETLAAREGGGSIDLRTNESGIWGGRDPFEDTPTNPPIHIVRHGYDRVQALRGSETSTMFRRSDPDPREDEEARELAEAYIAAQELLSGGTLEPFEDSDLRRILKFSEVDDSLRIALTGKRALAAFPDSVADLIRTAISSYAGRVALNAGVRQILNRRRQGADRVQLTGYYDDEDTRVFLRDLKERVGILSSRQRQELWLAISLGDMEPAVARDRLAGVFAGALLSYFADIVADPAWRVHLSGILHEGTRPPLDRNMPADAQLPHDPSAVTITGPITRAHATSGAFKIKPKD